MKLYTLERSQCFNHEIEHIWEFFSSPKNLSRITPGYMEFQIVTPLPKEMYPGMIIQYVVKPFANFPMKWTTEITQLKEPYFFIDEQRLGPYAFWHHQHHFEEVENGTKVTDIVNYALPFGILGRLAHGIFVKSQLEFIFDFREKALKKLLGEPYQQQLI